MLANVTPQDIERWKILAADEDLFAPDGGAGKERNLTVSEVIQRVYLGVGKVITADEACQIVNDEAGTKLAIPGPDFSVAPAPTFNGTG
jgi:hypothetical protein